MLTLTKKLNLGEPLNWCPSRKHQHRRCWAAFCTPACMQNLISWLLPGTLIRIGVKHWGTMEAGLKSLQSAALSGNLCQIRSHEAGSWWLPRTGGSGWKCQGFGALPRPPALLGHRQVSLSLCPDPFWGSPLPCPLPQLPSHAPSPSHPPQDPVCPAGSVPFPFWGSGTSQIAQVPVLILICWELASVMGACKSSSGTGSPRLPPHWSPLAVSSPGCIVISCDEAFQKTK